MPDLNSLAYQIEKTLTQGLAALAESPTLQTSVFDSLLKDHLESLRDDLKAWLTSKNQKVFHAYSWPEAPLLFS